MTGKITLDPYEDFDVDNPQHVTDISRMIEEIAPILADYHPAVQGMVLGELLSTWICGHHPASTRQHLLDSHMQAVRALVALDDGNNA